MLTSVAPVGRLKVWAEPTAPWGGGPGACAPGNFA